MTSYTCDQGHVFVHPAKVLVPRKTRPWVIQTDSMGSFETVDVSLETHVCPECQSIHYKETPQTEESIEKVYVADLNAGANPVVDELLARGWIIKARYAKQYHLEKPKTEEKP